MAKFLYDVQNEPIKENENLKCFLGAWYHKVVSTKFNWQGITGVLTLPKVKIRRYNDLFDESLDLDYNVRNLDVSSIYIGGFAENESDVGLALFRGYIKKDGVDVISNGSLVFRPFWRYITNLDADEGTYDLENGRNYASTVLSNHGSTKNCYAQYHPSFTEHYYLPGDKLRMTISSPKENYMQMKIEVLEVSTYPESVKLRKEHGWKQPIDFLSPVFSSPGHGTNMIKEYKRVNAIDQVSNEGKPSIDTKTEVMECIWENCYLLYKEKGEEYLVPLNNKRANIMKCPIETRFSVSPINELTGSSIVSIHPGYDK